MTAAIERLKNRVRELETLDINSIEKASDPAVKRLETSIENTISSVFGPDSHQYNQLQMAWHLDMTSYRMTVDFGRGGRGGTTVNEIREGVDRGRKRAIALLQQTADSLNEELAYHVPAASLAPAMAYEETPLSDEVFVVHGHVDAARLEVCALMTKAGLHPIVLHEQPNKGQTVIEKLEAHSNVGFAVVLLTPDDVGGAAGGVQQPRARQNVIAELFYFIGKLGRSRVCALKAGDLEIPSDVGGVVYVPYDPHGGWKNVLLRELEAAGYKFDWGKVLR